MSSNNTGGRTIVVFLVLMVVVLISGMAISLFFLQKETQTRKETELLLDDVKTQKAKAESELQDASKQIEVLKGKNKDADERINNLMTELDLKVALSDSIKAENKKVKELMEAESKAKEEIRQKLTAELETVRVELKTVQSKEKVSADEVLALRQKMDDLRKKNDELDGKIKDLESAAAKLKAEQAAAAQAAEKKVELDRIVVNPEQPAKGHIINVDTATEFVICDLGQKSGVKTGDILQVYRGKSLLGEIKVSRLQEEMSAADFIAPLSSGSVRKGDQVVQKR